MPHRRLLGLVLATALLSLALHLPTVQAHTPSALADPEGMAFRDRPPTSADVLNVSELDQDDQSPYALTIAEPEADDDDRVTLMLAVFGAAGFAAIVGSVGYLLRRLLGLVKPPPEPPPSEHH